jgi:hypothetical protein
LSHKYAVRLTLRRISGSNLTILSGSQGVSDMAVGLAAQGLSIFEALRQSVGRAPAMTDKTAGAEQEDGERGSTGYLGGDNGRG